MIRLYTDGSYDNKTGIGTFCVVIVDEAGEKEWFVKSCDDKESSNGVEYAGIVHCLDIVRERNVSAAIYCDNMSAIDRAKKKSKGLACGIFHLKGHQYMKSLQHMTDDMKYQNWCDIQARHFLQQRLDTLKQERIIKDKET